MLATGGPYFISFHTRVDRHLSKFVRSRVKTLLLRSRTSPVMASIVPLFALRWFIYGWKFIVKLAVVSRLVVVHGFSLSADLSLTSAVIVLYVSDHSLLSPIVCIRVYHSIYGLEVLILCRDKRCWRSLSVTGLSIFLEAVRLLVIIFDPTATTLI